MYVENTYDAMPQLVRAPCVATREQFDISLLDRSHQRDRFTSGIAALDDYIRRYARQNQENDTGRSWVACEPGDKRVLGFHTLSAGSVEFQNVPEEIRRRLPRYPVPVIHLGRLAVDVSARGRGLGETLLLHALEQAARVSQSVAVYAVEGRAKDETARGFYLKYGFAPLVDDANHLYLSMNVIRRLF
jgi:ribosomal protein S18 acetylase RimI-like enzyme